MNELILPEPISTYFHADSRDGEDVALCFSKDAVVVDEGQRHCGREAIQAWKAAASAKYSYCSEPLALEQKNGQHIVTSRLTGNFPGSPINLRYVFHLNGSQIASLEIIQ